jgi:hypothetical protein
LNNHRGEGEDGQQSVSILILFGGNFFFFFQLIEGFSMEKGPNSPYFMIKKNPRCQIFNIRSRRSPRIQRGPYVFLFSYMVYHQIWLILLLASHHFVYTTKLNKKKKKQKKQSKKHWLQGIGTGRKKGSC